VNHSPHVYPQPRRRRIEFHAGKSQESRK
jgi:hypothetical protein